MYNQIVLDHFQNPRNLQDMKDPSATGMGASQVCGDVMTLYLKIDGNKIKNATFKTVGCGAAIASGSILTELLKNKTLAEARAINAQTLVEALGGLPKIKLHCPDLAIEALDHALKTHA
jgi:nitrogen fixation NifU-like protein